MRNSKVKGFTLIELIVVIAIIGVLAAILVPSMLGYVRQARISSANANAKTVHTAVAAVLTQAGIDGKDIGTATAVTGDILGSDQAAGGGVTGMTAITTGGSDTLDLSDHLGEEFKGYAYACYNGATYACKYAVWAASQTVAGTSAITDPAAAQGTPSAEDQLSDAKDSGAIVGYYPLDVDLTASSST